MRAVRCAFWLGINLANERLTPAFEAVGVSGPPPQFWPVHDYLTSGRQR